MSAITHIATVETTASGSVTFSSIPTTYKHLKLIAQNIGNDARVTSPGGNFFRSYLRAIGTTYQADRLTSVASNLRMLTSSGSMLEIDFLNYSNAMYYNGFTVRHGNGQGAVYLVASFQSVFGAMEEFGISAVNAGATLSLYGVD